MAVPPADVNVSGTASLRLRRSVEDRADAAFGWVGRLISGRSGREHASRTRNASLDSDDPTASPRAGRWDREPSRSTGDRGAHEANRSSGRFRTWSSMDDSEPTLIKRLLERLLATRARRDAETRFSDAWRAADTELHAIERAIFRGPAQRRSGERAQPTRARSGRRLRAPGEGRLLGRGPRRLAGRGAGGAGYGPRLAG